MDQEPKDTLWLRILWLPVTAVLYLIDRWKTRNS